jgi:aspartyl-tRNA(Asn)/glutamyl-tRNA(Gln) amidotransferase subunit C
MAFTPEDVQRLAQLARIELDPEQVNATLGHLDNIFSMIAELRQINTSGTAPMAHARDVGQRLRDDQVTEGSIEQRDRCLTLAPESEAGLYLVPKVIE